VIALARAVAPAAARIDTGDDRLRRNGYGTERADSDPEDEAPLTPGPTDAETDGEGDRDGDGNGDEDGAGSQREQERDEEQPEPEDDLDDDVIVIPTPAVVPLPAELAKWLASPKLSHVDHMLVTWSCTNCTLDNQRSTKRCVACNAFISKEATWKLPIADILPGMLDYTCTRSGLPMC